jgi:hypothetical protein
MTSLLEGARRLVARGSDLGGRIEALQSATAAARGRLDDELVDQAEEARYTDLVDSLGLDAEVPEQLRRASRRVEDARYAGQRAD